jgi:tRNA A-37 threonylcarbamoyl transferase component Bud32
VITAGQTIGNYRILNKIGTGGMGAVYLAEHPLIGKRVALKVIHRELAGNRDVVSRFFQEARAVNKIGNEHIVEIHDFGVTPEGDHFIIMEYLEGRTLASILSRETALDVMRSLHVGAQIASALASAHAAGIIHRDLKPDNIMLMARLGDPDFVKVLDFGLAKVFSAATAVKTAAGVLLGTPQYMSPEACESKRDIDHRTDIYALGVLLFQMMTGVLPFDGESMGEVLVKQVTALPPAPRGLNPAIPPSVEQILLRCLAKPVDARFATMQKLRDALLDPEAYLHGSPPIAPARSVVPGEAVVDARTVMAYAVEQQKTRMATANPHPLPLPAPAPSLAGQGSAPTMLAERGDLPIKRATVGMPAMAQPQEFKMNTMRIATPLGYSSQPPRKVWPIVLVMALLLGLVGGAFAVAWSGRGNGPAKPGDDDARTATGGNPGSAADLTAKPGSAGSNTAAASIGSGAGPAAAGTPTGGNPGGAGAAGTQAGAGSAGTQAGSGSTGTQAGSGGAGTQAGSSTVGAGSGSGAGGVNAGSGIAGATGGSGTARPDAGSGSAARPPPKPITAHLSIDSVPPGAAVTDSDGASLGKTPIKIEWPISDLPVTFELRLGGYKRKQQQIVVNGNTALRVELERAVVIRHNGGGAKNGSAKAGSGGNGLMRPDE